jgi:uncharacterized protein YkwD
MTCLVNGVRRSHGLAPLHLSSLLDRSSWLRAAAIRRCGDFSHTPCGQPFLRPFARVGYVRGRFAVGENLAWGSSALGSPAATVAAWLRSPEHRGNLLSRGWHDLGVALLHASGLFGSADVNLWVAQFGSRR